MFEKKRGTRFLASVMALVMMLSLAPVGALAVEDEEQNQDVVALPADGDNPKPVVTDEGNTANTNEEPTSPPPNKGDTIIPTDNNNTSTAISEAEIIPEKELIDEAFGVDSKEEIQQYGSKENGNAVVQYSVSGSNTVKVGETITLTCDNNSRWHNHSWRTFGNSVAVEGDTDSNTITVKGLKEGTATVYCGRDSKQINVTHPQYVIRFYVSGTGTEGLYDEQNKYSVAGQPNSTFENADGDNPLELYVSAGYAILTEYTDTAKDITTNQFINVKVEGDAAVRKWLTTYANHGVQEGLTDRNNVEKIVENVNKQYTDANNNYYKDKGITLPLLKTNHYNGFRFVDAYYVPSGESTIHVNVQLVKNTEYIVRYEPNGGVGNAYEDSTLYLNGQQASVKSNTFTKAGYTFNGWNTEANGSGASYNPNGDNNKVTIGTANVTLYAQWKAKEYKVKYDLNYKGAPDTLEDKTGVKWEDNGLLPSGNNPSRGGYNFHGWYTQATDGEKVDATTAYSSIAKNDTDTSVTLYAHWTEDTTAKPATTDVYVYFKMVDAAGNNISRNKINNEDLKKTVYNKEADGATWATLGKIALTGDITEYTLTNAGEAAQVQLKNDGNLWSQNKDIAQTVLANVQWFQLKQWAGATDYVPDGSRWHLDGKITGYTVTYNKGTTDSVDKMPVADEVVYYLSGSDYTVSDATPTRDGYVFTGWKSDNNVYASKSKMNMPAKNVVLTAQWEVDNWKDADEAGKDSENGGDGIPDRYQVTIIYRSSDEDKGTVSTKKEVLTIKKDDEKIPVEDAMIKGSKATDNGGRNYFSNWTDEVNNKTINDATLTADTIKKAIEAAKGGETYTFTANFDRSSGGGSGGSNRPKPPVVDIPDDVPTGLNGKDHYAYIIGYGNNDVRPQNNITRAEVATIFFRLLTDETREANMTKSNGYNDVKDGDWFCCAVSTLSKMGIIKGYEDGSFKPNDPISRAEFAAIAARFDPDGDKTPASFSDVTSHWAKDEISIAANHGWIKGYEDGSFKPDQKITRAETMTLVNRVLNRLPEAKDDLHKDMKTWVDNMDETAWYYLAVQEATNSHYFKNKTGTKFEQWTDLRDTRDWSKLEK